MHFYTKDQIEQKWKNLKIFFAVFVFFSIVVFFALLYPIYITIADRGVTYIGAQQMYANPYSGLVDISKSINKEGRYRGYVDYIIK